MNSHQMEITAGLLTMPGKGILAADESQVTIEKRLRKSGVNPTDENLRAYRELLFTTPSLGQFISGVSLCDEAFRQKTAVGRWFVEELQRQRVIPGIRVDKGAKVLEGFPGENITEGLDGLRERLIEYSRLGAQFFTWRAAFSIGQDVPSRLGLTVNAHVVARFAALSQEVGLVPIVELEVLTEGDHPMDLHSAVTENVLTSVFQALAEHRVCTEAMLLKANMVLPGKAFVNSLTSTQIAEATLQCMLRSVPAAVKGIFFLSGGQSDQEVMERLRVLNRFDKTPWEMSFSFGRALESAALETWRGKSENVVAAQEALFYRAECVSAARFGTTFVKNNFERQRPVLV